MRRQILFVSVALMLLTGAVSGQALVRIAKAELARTAIVAGDLKITIKDTSNGVFGGGPGVAEIEVENTGKAAVVFNPQRLSFVGADGRQVDVLSVLLNVDNRAEPRELLIIDGARSKQTYVLNGKVAFPSRLYYQGTVLAELVD